MRYRPLLGVGGKDVGVELGGYFVGGGGVYGCGAEARFETLSLDLREPDLADARDSHNVGVDLWVDRF